MQLSYLNMWFNQPKCFTVRLTTKMSDNLIVKPEFIRKWLSRWLKVGRRHLILVSARWRVKVALCHTPHCHE